MIFDVEAFYARELRLAFGAHREDKNWRTRKLTLGKLVEECFGGFTRGHKDGPAMTQGALVGMARKSKAAQCNYIVMVDIDVGETMDEIAAKIEARGLYALLWTTYSHGKPESEVPESKLVHFLRKDPDWLRDRSPSDDPAVLERQCADYLSKIKKIAPAVLDGVTGVAKRLTEKGMLYTVQHGPMPRIRAMFIKDVPFDFAARGTQDDAIDEWKDRYAGFSEALGLPYDPSCVDPARLMYLPRIPRDADEADYEIREIEGRALTLDDMPRASKKVAQPKDALAAAVEYVTGNTTGKQAKWKTPGLAKFLAEHGNDFEVEEFLEAHGSENRGPTTTGTCFECPTDALHSDPGNPDDKGFWAQNASSREGGFACSCSHATCKAAAIEATGKVDRAWFLDEFCATHGLSVDDLLEYCPNHMREEDERIEEEVKTGDALTDAINALTRETPVTQIMDVLELLAKTPADLICNDRLKLIKEKTGHGIVTLRDQLTAFRLAANAGGDGGDDGNEIRDAHPVPEDGADASIIWGHWGYSDMVRCVRERLIAKNAENPIIFARPEGGYCRRQIIGDKVVFRNVVENSDWVNILTTHMKFMQPMTERSPEREVSPFKDVIIALQGMQDLPFGVIERVVEVPVFNINGGLRTTEGYDKDARTWFHPRREFIAIPEKPEQADIDAARSILDEMYIDFPFSDCYTGVDPLPIKWIGEDGKEVLDDDGHPIPNYERGKASRANTIAMLLSPFARSLIDGPCPLFFIDKPAPGTGGNYLADTLGFALLGTKMPTQTVSANEEELRKQLTATIRDGDAAVCFDNLNHELDSGALASTLSTGVYVGRILGQSDNVSLPVRATWLLIANSGKLSRELMRRVVPIHLDAATANPAADRDPASYKYDLGTFCRNNRDSVVWACHVLIQNWLVNAGRKQNRKRVIQTFEEWAGVMGGILSSAGIEGFLENVDAYLSNRTDTSAALTDFVQRIYDRASGDEFTAGEAFDWCLMMGTTDKIDPDLGLELKGREEAGMRRSMGALLGKMVGQSYRLANGKQYGVTKTDKKTKNKAHYRLIENTTQYTAQVQDLDTAA
jgi:hypothetical protein